MKKLVPHIKQPLTRPAMAGVSGSILSGFAKLIVVIGFTMMLPACGNLSEPRWVNTSDIGKSQELTFFVDSYARGRIAGWAFIAAADSRDSAMYVMLREKSGITALRARVKPQVRQDVSLHFKAGQRYNESGFHLNLNSLSVPSGSYEIGLLVIGGNGEQAIKWTKLYYDAP